MNGRGYNHRVQNLDIALIEGGTVQAFCGIEFKPRLRVGSSGKADDPALPWCPECDEIRDARIRLKQLLAEIEERQDQLGPLLDIVKRRSRREPAPEHTSADA